MGGEIILTLICLKESLEQFPLMKKAVIRSQTDSLMRGASPPADKIC